MVGHCSNLEHRPSAVAPPIAIRTLHEDSPATGRSRGALIARERVVMH
jgi:hypothetical protein